MEASQGRLPVGIDQMHVFAPRWDICMTHYDMNTYDLARMGQQLADEIKAVIDMGKQIINDFKEANRLLRESEYEAELFYDKYFE